MKTFALLISILIAIAAPAFPQEPDAPEGTKIASVRVSGMDDDDLSPGLRASIDSLVGQNIDWIALAEIAGRIEDEQPGRVAAVRAPMLQSGDARIVFVVGRDGFFRRDESNINERYTIERVAIDGVPDSAISQALRDELQALVGTRLDRRSRSLTTRLREELDGYQVERRVARGSQRGQVVLTYEVRQGERMRLVPFTPTASKFVYHENQGWSGVLDLLIGTRNLRVAPRFVFDNRDDLVEEYSGVGVRVETRHVGVEHLGLSLDISRFDPTWLPETEAALAANPALPAAYDRRTTVAPSVTVGLPWRVRFSGGVSVTDLVPLTLGRPSTMASVLTAGVGYDDRWTRGAFRHSIDASASVRSSADSLGSDLAYRRVSGRGSYRLRWEEDSTLIATLAAGRLTGAAPLFERFTLGDTTTLRGWNKYDITPAGADRMVHGSLEYRFHGASLFFDAGSLGIRDHGTGNSWSSGVRTSTGAGLHFDNFFATVGFPLNADGIRSTFMIGVRF